MGEYLSDLWEDRSANWKVAEAVNEQKAGNKAILGTVRGPFFFPDGVSENKRFYPRALWEKVLKEDRVKKKMGDRLMFGKIGHDDRPVSDQDLQEGVVSHVVTKLFVNSNGIGMGEALILDTPAGRNLWTLLKAGSKIKISSRATGSFQEGAQHNGMPIVDPNNYILETFDFVLNAGFGSTDPRLTEALQANQKTKPKMNEELINKLMANRDQAQASLTEALSKNAILENRINELQRSLERSNSPDLKKLEYLGESIAKKFGHSSVATLLERLNEIDLEAVEAVQQSGISEEALNEYVDLGSPEEISEAADAAIQALEAYHELGTIQEIEEALDLADEALDGYLQLGTVSELQEALSRLEELEELLYEHERAETAMEKSREYGVDVAVVESIIEKVGTGDDLDAILESTSIGSRTNEVISKGERKFNQPAVGRLFESLNHNNKN